MGRKPREKLLVKDDITGKEVELKPTSGYYKLKVKHMALIEDYNKLKKLKIDENVSKVDEAEVEKLKAEIEKLRIAYNDLEASKTKIETIEQINHVPIKLAPNEYIMELDPDLSKKIVRCIAYLKHKDKLKEIEPKDYLKVFTELALNYLIKENFNDIIK